MLPLLSIQIANYPNIVFYPNLVYHIFVVMQREIFYNTLINNLLYMEFKVT